MGAFFPGGYIVEERGNAIRLLRCSLCNHRLRFGASNCGKSWRGAPLLNRWSTWAALLLALAALWLLLG